MLCKSKTMIVVVASTSSNTSDSISASYVRHVASGSARVAVAGMERLDELTFLSLDRGEYFEGR